MESTQILLCEDDTNIRWTLAKLLRQQGAVVHEAADGAEGLKFLSKEKYDLLISDICMPGVGGFGLFAALRFGEGDQFADHRAMPIVLMSGHVEGPERARALDAGVDEFIPKPMDPDEFISRVKSVIRRARRGAPPQGRTSGDLEDFPMHALVQALHMAGRNARLRIQTDNAAGLLHFQRGEISHAIYETQGNELRGDFAAVQVLSMKTGTFQFEALPDVAPRTVFADTERMVLRAAAHSDEMATAGGMSPE